ncbi:MAG: sensor histidine kinase [Polyangiales bacterium]
MSDRKSTSKIRVRRPSARTDDDSYRRIVMALIWLVLLPSALLIAVGMILLVRGKYDWNLIIGILVLLFCGLLATGSVLVWIFVTKERNLSQLQTDFVSKVSHELKTPLTSIRLFVETLALKRASDPAQIDECLKLLARETDRLTQRIDQLLEWGRMEAGRRAYQLRAGDLYAVVEGAIASFAPMHLQGDVELTLTKDEGVPPTLMDASAIEAAVLNLLSNAYKYGGSPRTIDVHVGVRGPERVPYVRVTDNGNGIPKHDHKRIFEKFYRRDDSLARSAEGSGLGLAIVAHTVKGHGGRIGVDSEDGRGASFILELRAAPLA